MRRRQQEPKSRNRYSIPIEVMEHLPTIVTWGAHQLSSSLHPPAISAERLLEHFVQPEVRRACEAARIYVLNRMGGRDQIEHDLETTVMFDTNKGEEPVRYPLKIIWTIEHDQRMLLPDADFLKLLPSMHDTEEMNDLQAWAHNHAYSDLRSGQVLALLQYLSVAVPTPAELKLIWPDVYLVFMRHEADAAVAKWIERFRNMKPAAYAPVVHSSIRKAVEDARDTVGIWALASPSKRPEVDGVSSVQRRVPMLNRPAVPWFDGIRSLALEHRGIVASALVQVLA